MSHQPVNRERLLFEERLAALPPLYREVLYGVKFGRAIDDLASLSGIATRTIERLTLDLDEL